MSATEITKKKIGHLPPIFLSDKNTFVPESTPYITVTEMREEILAHELAHYIDYLERGFTDHDMHWANICRELGGTGSKYLNGDPI